MKLGRSGAHPEPLEEVFPRNVGTGRNMGCHRPQEFYVYAVNCKQYLGFDVEIRLGVCRLHTVMVYESS